MILVQSQLSIPLLFLTEVFPDLTLLSEKGRDKSSRDTALKIKSLFSKDTWNSLKKVFSKET